MKIAINDFPLRSAHKNRGIGYYTRHLISELKQRNLVNLTEFSNLNTLKDVDVIHYPWFDLFFHTLTVKRRFPTVVTIHDVMPLVFSKHYPVGLRGKINFLLQRIALRNCRYVITDSQASKKDIKKYLKVTDKKIVVIPLAVDKQFKVLKDPELIRVKYKYHLPDEFLLYVGDANWVKNLTFLIEGFAKLLSTSRYQKLKLVLAGGVFLKNVENINHPELESLRKLNMLIKQYKLEDHIIRPGVLENNELVAFYNLAALYIQPSIYEGFGLPILQAFACATPVMSSTGGSLPEVGGMAALYFNPNDLNQFVSLLESVLQDRALRYKLSKAGLEQAKKFSWEKVADQTIDVYKRVIAKND